MPHRPRRIGFTLVELLVVISIIALLIGILLPALGRARESAQRTVIAANLRSVGQAVSVYNAENKDLMPNSYLYAASQDPEDTPRSIQAGTADGSPTPYVHWSWSLLDGAAAPPDAFTSPAVLNGGAPRTNPGADLEDWEAGQIDAVNEEATNPDLWDYQAPRMAFGGNDAIFPRNKLIASTGERRNIDVVISTINQNMSRLILASEFHYSEVQGWRGIRRQSGAVGDGGEWKSVSHRPITPFLGLTAGTEVYAEIDTGTRRFSPFVYPNPTPEVGQIWREDDPRLDNQALLDNGDSLLNAVSRIHNGRAHFVFMDGHVDAMELQETIKNRLWGERFYSISGDNRVSDEFVFGGARFEDLD
jgi:prepilin-type N-terminal cleavage/methylation domain-containing protein/prepilin-type processing-associated H-X9-DG protein